jgi:type II secretory pathway pseudopilin PulG
MLRVRQRGDTLIEVLFAFSVLSLIVVGAMTLMNQGTAASQRSLETTLVRQQIDAQATTLRFLHGAYVAQYQPGTTYAADTAAGQWQALTDEMPITSASNINSCPMPRPTGSFILDPLNAEYVPLSSNKLQAAQTFAQLVYDQAGEVLLESQGLWIEAVAADTDQENTRYIDFHIYACWDSPGAGPPVTLGTIVRLYEPR